MNISVGHTIPRTRTIEPKGLSRGWPVLRFGIVLKPTKPLSPDQAYDIGQVFYANASAIAQNYGKELKRLFRGRNLDIRAAQPEPRYRMTPAIIIDYPQVGLLIGNKRAVNSRLCFTVGAEDEFCKIWMRINFTGPLAISQFEPDIKAYAAACDNIVNNHLLTEYRALARKIAPKADFDVHTRIKILIVSFDDKALKHHLMSFDENWNVFGNFLTQSETPPKRYHQVLSTISLPTEKAKDTNFVIYRAPVSRRGRFNNSSNDTFCSLLRFDITRMDTSVCGICYEHGAADTQLSDTDSSAHVASGELCFELGRLY